MAKVAAVVSMALGTAVVTAGPADAIVSSPNPGQYYHIIAAAVGDPLARQCLDVPDGTKEAGVQIQTYHCHANDAQYWQFIPTGVDGTYLIQNKASNLCLWDLDPDDILQEPCTSIVPERVHWKLIPSFFDTHGTRIWNGYWAWCLTVTTATDHAKPELQPCTTSEVGDNLSLRQDWKL